LKEQGARRPWELSANSDSGTGTTDEGEGRDGEEEELELGDGEGAKQSLGEDGCFFPPVRCARAPDAPCGRERDSEEDEDGGWKYPREMSGGDIF
jgi:hypothetical protein